MRFLKIKLVFLVFYAMLTAIPKTKAQLPLDDRHISVALRMIGHRMLLNAGDSSSRVLPVLKNNDTYRISFESSFRIQPDKLVRLVDSVVTLTKLAQAYLVQVEQCGTKEVVYSFEMGRQRKVDLVPCMGRELPLNCYSVLFSIIEYPVPPTNSSESNLAYAQPSSHVPVVLSVALLIILTSLWVYFRRKRENEELKANVFPLGAYAFDTLNMELRLNGKKTELTAKESELLLLLYQCTNTTVERNAILNRVWGDEGDYVGRTLDVFISKLRKKLEADPDLKIMNIRGVGYKLVANG